ncbi:MAG: C40 family peptidase [Cytophagales bacterium]|nr:C40 family peptidase [Cytophagales bacterium]
MRLKKITCYLTALFALTLSVTACKSSHSGGRRKLTVVTYEKKRGSRTASPSQRHYGSRSKTGKGTSVDVEEKAGAGSRGTTAKRRSGNATAEAQKAIQVARSYIGTPYKYGGTTRRGIDCSGLLCTTFQAIDIALPRPSYEQAEYGQEVRLRDVRPGDLVFFSEKKSSNRVSHAGMVTEVNGPADVTFIHASTSRGVIEDNLYKEYYQKIFVKAVRPF